jgi:hypothetical protein
MLLFTGSKVMTKELQNLMIQNGPLPDGTRIKTTIGGVKTGKLDVSNEG